MQKPTNPTASNTTAVESDTNIYLIKKHNIYNNIIKLRVLLYKCNKRIPTYYYGPRGPWWHFRIIRWTQRVGRGRNEWQGRRP